MFVALLFFLQLVLPVLILLWTALLPFYQPPSAAALQSASLGTFAAVLSKPRVLLSLGNTALLVLVAATITMLLASVIAWLAQRRQRKAAWLLDLLAFVPLAIPGVVMALALLLLLVRTPLYGTVWILVIGHVAAFLPFCVRLMGAALIQLRPELEEAARTSGAGPLVAFGHIVLPLVLPSIIDGWVWVFAHSLRDFTFPLMFRTTQNVVIATLIWELWNQPDTPGAAALSVLLVLLVLATAVVLRSVTARAFGSPAVNRVAETG
jgi:iron(III) transport system permease protein